MRLLVCTQAIDERDPSLGFFIRWIGEIAAHFEHVIAVCLKEGTHALPGNVRVLSLGKESGPSRLKYVVRLFRYVWGERGNYDAVFVHQNQEYVLLAGWLWKLLGKRIFMWRNHYAGSFLTGIAALLCSKIFCTSTHSYTVRYKKTVLMPVGVDTDMFRSGVAPRTPHSILFLGRIASSKRPDVLVGALGILKGRGIEFSASLWGPTLPGDEMYRTSLMQKVGELNLTNKVSFREGVPHGETPALYASHEIFVNLSMSGMYDKTLFEAAACGCLVVSASKDFAKLFEPRFTFENGAEALAACLSGVLELSSEEKNAARHTLRDIADRNSLHALGERLAEEIV